MLIGALEAGGTKMVCAVGKEDGSVLEQVSIPTTTPEETIPQILDYFKSKEIGALGVAAFGPVDVKPASPTYGFILNTPKIPWRNCDLLGQLKRELAIPIGLDTDVNGSCLGEMAYGCARGLENVIYITIGTGVGVGVCCGGKLVHGMLHPEGGHILLSRHPKDPKGGICPNHPNCLEGFACGPSIEARWGKGSRAGRRAFGVGNRELLYCSGSGRFYHDPFSSENYSGRRRYASGTAVSADPPSGEGDGRRLSEHSGTGGSGTLYRSRQSWRGSGDYGLY